MPRLRATSIKLRRCTDFEVKSLIFLYSLCFDMRHSQVYSQELMDGLRPNSVLATLIYETCLETRF